VLGVGVTSIRITEPLVAAAVYPPLTNAFVKFPVLIAVFKLAFNRAVSVLMTVQLYLIETPDCNNTLLPDKAVISPTFISEDLTPALKELAVIDLKISLKAGVLASPRVTPDTNCVAARTVTTDVVGAVVGTVVGGRVGVLVGVVLGTVVGGEVG
jgi:hypothetical protein